MSATINIFKSAFKTDYNTILTASGKKIKEATWLDWKNTLISVNGKKADENYILQDGDLVTIRQFPSNTAGKWATAIGWIFTPVTSAIIGLASGDWRGTLVVGGEHLRDYIRSLFEQEDSSSSSGSTESIPTISGAKNQSGADKVIPLLIGETMYTPIYCAQAYTDIDPTDGSDGENQYFHALYCLGYRDIDLKSVSLGIYPLTTDEQDGTSKASLDCTNYQTSYGTQILTQTVNQTFSVNGNNTTEWANPYTKWDDSNYKYLSQVVIKISITGSDYDITSFDSVSYTSLSITGYCQNIINHKKQNVNCTISSVYIEYGKIKIVAVPDKKVMGVFFKEFKLSGAFNITCTAKLIRNTVHYSTDKYFQQLELRQNGEEVDLFPQKVAQENFNTELLHPEGADALIIQPFSAKYPQKVQLEIQFQNLVKYDDEGKMNDNEVEVGVAYSMDGGMTYKAFPRFDASNSEITISDGGTGTFSDGSGTYQITKFSGKKNKAMRFVAEKSFSFDEVFNTDDTTNLRNNAVEFKIFRVGEDKSTSDSKLQYKVYFSSIRTWCYDYKKTKEQYDADNANKSLVIQRPVAEKYMKMTARLGFKIKAGEELTGQIDELNVIMKSRARYCTITTDDDGEKSYSWSGAADTQPTNNPAALALMILQHPMRGEYAYTDDMLDKDSFGRFYEFCNQTDSELINSDGHRYTANGVLSKEMKTLDLVNQILAVGHGKLVMNGTKYGVWYDYSQDTPVMVLNNQNVLEASNSKAFNEDIDGYSAKFIDSLNDYQEDTQVCVETDNEKDESKYKLENIEVPWITDIKRVYRHCMYTLACRKLRPEIWNRKVSVDGNLLEIGSLIEIQDDTISVGIGDGAEIVNVTASGNYITSIKVDYPFTVTDTKQTYGVKIQHASENSGIKVLTYKLADFTETGEYTELAFADSGISLDEALLPARGDIVSFGIYEKETTPALVYSKKDNGDGTFDLQLVPYQEGVYKAEEGTIPDFKTNVTSPKISGAAIAEEIPTPTYEDVDVITDTKISALASAIDVNKYTLDISPEAQSIPVDKDGNLLSSWFYISAYLYYKDAALTENVEFKAYLNDGVSEVGTWDGDTVRISSSYLKGDILYITIKAVYTLDSANTLEKTLKAQVSRLYSDSVNIYKMLFPDGEKVKVDDTGKVVDPTQIRALKRVKAGNVEDDTRYGYITLEVLPSGAGTEAEYEPYDKVETTDSYGSDKTYYESHKPFLLSAGDGYVVGAEEDVAGLFYER